MPTNTSSGRRRTCLSPEELQAYCVGKLPVKTLEEIAEHVETCSSCQSGLEVVELSPSSNDSLINNLRRYVADQPPTPKTPTAKEESAAVTMAEVRPSPSDAPDDEHDADGAEADPYSGIAFGPYQLLERIGRGGMGVVYKARQLSLNRFVAIKMIRAGDYGDAEQLRRFRTECQAVARLQHPHVVQVHEFSEHDGQPFLSMEFLEGGSLSRKLAGSALPARAAAEVVLPLALALQFAHEHMIIHRDLKPSNVLLTADSVPKIADFGLAKLLDEDSGSTNTGTLVGTPSYMAPEQAAGNPMEVGPLADVYALGAILYELLTGRPPFREEGRLETLDKVRTAEPVPPSRLQRGIPRDLEAICLKCLAKKPAQRYVSAEALAEDLQALAARRTDESAAAVLAGPPLRRHPRVAAAMLSLAVLAASVFAVLDWRDPDRPLNEQILPKLANKQPVILLGETGAPLWSRWIVPGTRTSGPDAPFSFNAGTLCLLELLPEMPLERYRFRVQVRQERTGTGYAGLYCCRTGHDVSLGRIHGFVAVKFADWGTKAVDYGNQPWSVVAMDLYDIAQAQPGLRFVYGLGTKRFDPAWKAPGGNLKWRSLAVEVTPEVVRAFFDGELVYSLAAASRREFAKTLTVQRPHFEGVKPEFPPRGGLGLYLDQTAVSFRNAVVEPLEQ